MRPWHIFSNHDDTFFSTDVDLYACTRNAWSIISNVISVLHEEPWATEWGRCRGLLRGYVSNVDLRYIWFNQRLSADSNEFESNTCSGGHGLNNILLWFYMPKSYRHFTRTLVEAKNLQFGKVPFQWRRTGNEAVIHSATPIQCTQQTNQELTLVASDSKDVIFYCAQSLHLSPEALSGSRERNNFEDFTIPGFPHHPFRFINAYESCNISARGVSVQPRSMMMEGPSEPHGITGMENPTYPSLAGRTDEFQVEDRDLPLSIKEEFTPYCEVEAKVETQEDSGPSQDHSNSRHGIQGNCDQGKVLDFDNIMSISRKYATLASERDRKHRELGEGSRRRLVPQFIIECPACDRRYRPNPASLWNMLRHIRTKHREHCHELLSSMSALVQTAIVYMKERINVWSRANPKKRGQTVASQP